MADGAVTVVHATAVAVGGAAVLIRGPSGAGKSDLALRLMALSDGTFNQPSPRLVADDQVRVQVENGRLIASAPRAIAGRIEVRGVGILEVDALPEAEVRLIVDLVDRAVVPRLPEPETALIAGVAVSRLALTAFDAATPLKIVLALARVASR